MIHAKATKPFIYPKEGDVAPSQIDRCQDIAGDITLSKDKVYEIGRIEKLGNKDNTPSLKYTLKQFEYGSMTFWYKLANINAPASAGLDESVDLDDIKAKFFDITSVLTDEDVSNTFRGTVYFPNLRVNGFSINIGDPDAIIERNFDLIGEDYKVLGDATLGGKYFAYQKATVAAPGDEAIVLRAVAIQYASGDYIFKVLRVRAGVTTALEEGSAANEWAYVNGTATLTVKSCLASDVVKVYYMAATASAAPVWADNDVDADFLQAKHAEIYLKVGVGVNQLIHRLQSVGIDVAFERTDYKEIGNDEVVQTGVKSKTTKVTLGRLMEEFTVEEILRGTSAYPYIDTRTLAEDVVLTVKLFSDTAHANFVMGYKITGLTATAISSTHAVEDYQKQNNTVESDNFIVTNDESEL